MFPFLAAAGTLGGLIGGIFKGSQGRKQQRMADAIHPVDANYETSPYAQNQLSTVQQMMNGRMAGAGAEEQNIQGNFANAMSGVNRNATNGAQSLAMLAGLQGNTNRAFSDLQTKENMNKQSLLGQLAYANQGMTAEGDKVYGDKLRKFNNDMNAKNALQSAAWQNKGAFWNGLSNALVGVGNMAEQGAFNKNGGGNGGSMGGQSAPYAQLSPDQQVGAYNPPALSGGSYINPFMQNPQQNYINPFIR